MVGYGDSGPYLIYSYKFTGFSGKPGPKLREFDRQMPEGIYLSLIHISEPTRP